jgi:DNA primase
MVSPAKGFGKILVRGKAELLLLMEHEHFTHPEPFYLARKYNIEIEETEQTNEENIYASIVSFAKRLFSSHTFKTEEGKAIGHSYFKERGFTNETIEKFSLDILQILGMLSQKKACAIN